MSIPKLTIKNFKTLQAAITEEQVCLLEAKRKYDDKIVILLCAVNFCDGEYEFIPFAEMIDSNPYELYYPPNSDGGFFDKQ